MRSLSARATVTSPSAGTLLCGLGLAKRLGCKFALGAFFASLLFAPSALASDAYVPGGVGHDSLVAGIGANLGAGSPFAFTDASLSAYFDSQGYTDDVMVLLTAADSTYSGTTFGAYVGGGAVLAASAGAVGCSPVTDEVSALACMNHYFANSVLGSACSGCVQLYHTSLFGSGAYTGWIFVTKPGFALHYDGVSTTFPANSDPWANWNDVPTGGGGTGTVTSAQMDTLITLVGWGVGVGLLLIVVPILMRTFFRED